MSENIKVNFNYDGVRGFIGTFKTTDFVNKVDILDMLNKPAYSELIRSFGCNFVSTKSEDWAEIFYEAYELAISKKQFLGEDVVKRNIISSVVWAINNVDQLEEYTNKIAKLLSTKEFLKKAMKYLPDLGDQNIDITINYYVFMYNACVQDGKVFIDIPFCIELGDEKCNDLLAHEMHHYLQNFLHINEGEVKEEYSDVIRPLSKLVSEGIADMCNFKSLTYIYEGFGWMEKGTLNKTLNNVEEYTNDLENLIIDRIVNNNTNVNINDFIYNNSIIHPIGYTMACIIENILGLNELRQCVGNPIRFMDKFNHAFKITNKRKVFSETTIESLYKLYK